MMLPVSYTHLASYSLLGLISFLTAGEDECRAWTIKKGTKAPQAAGKIHTDFERGFIKAEVVNYKDLMAVSYTHLDVYKRQDYQCLQAGDRQQYFRFCLQGLL